MKALKDIENEKVIAKKKIINAIKTLSKKTGISTESISIYLGRDVKEDTNSLETVYNPRVDIDIKI